MPQNKPITIALSELCPLIGAELEGPDANVSLICPIDDVCDGCLTYAERQIDFDKMSGGLPAAVIAGPKVKTGDIAALRSNTPKSAFARAIAVLHPARRMTPGVHPAAIIDPSAHVDPSAYIGPLCVIGSGALIAAGTTLIASVTVGADASIGKDCVLHPGVHVYDGSLIGDRVILHAGVVVGSDGFGYVRGGDGVHEKIPQVGNIVIGDDVEIGANSSLDRGAIGSTVIGSGTKIDNLVQIGHNTRIGRNVILCGQVGISGSVTIGDNAVLAGQAGIADHIRIGNNCVIAGKAGVDQSVPDNSFYSGHPARPHRENMRSLSSLRKLPELLEKLKKQLDQES